MNPEHPQRLDELAAQYVLGTLRGPARRRFERYCERSAAAMSAVHRWEDRLVDLLPVAPVTPSALVWERVKLRIRRDRTRHSPGTTPLFGDWRFAIAAGIAALAIAFGVWTAFGPGTAQPFASIVDQQQRRELWSIATTRSRDELRVAAANDIALDPARDYELWALPADGAAPVSLGLMPKSGRGTLPLSDAQRLGLSRSRQIAVSLEPRGGSPTGAPTGPVLYVADVATAG